MPRQVKTRATLAQRLIQLRHARGLTQVDLARAAKLSQRAVAHYETVGKNPPADIAGRLADALSISVDELLGHKPTPRNIPILKNRRLLKKIKQLDDLPANEQKKILSHIDDLSAKYNGPKH